LWMSATLNRDWLRTVDFEPQELASPITLCEEDFIKGDDLRRRHEAIKPLKPADHSAAATRDLAAEVFGSARTINDLTLVIVNTVQRACDLHREIERLARGREANLSPDLIHSRFRTGDRKKRMDELLACGGKQAIAVSTQVVEAGVDVS